MDYRIDYGSGRVKKQKTDSGKIGMRIFLAAVLLAGVICIRNLTTHWIPKETGQAVSALVTALSEGTSAEDALTVFCKEIIAHADFPE